MREIKWDTFWGSCSPLKWPITEAEVCRAKKYSDELSHKRLSFYGMGIVNSSAGRTLLVVFRRLVDSLES